MEDDTAWDNYVVNHARSNVYHSSHWQNIITSAYGYKSYSLAVVSNDPPSDVTESTPKVMGVLPLVHLKSTFFGNRLVSMPYVDHGGIIADNPEYEEKLIQAASDMGRRLKAKRIELRHLDKISFLEDGCAANAKGGADSADKSFPIWSRRSHKMRLLMPLPNTSDALMNSFKSKLRSQINRPVKAGLAVKIGGLELLDDFYTVFSMNMRDLGSPVHAKSLVKCVLNLFQNDAKIVLIVNAAKPVAAGIMVGFKDVMVNPWASSLRQHSKESPNMLLYWHMLAYAADHGFRYFDFGRSTPQEGTYRFKTQWGAQPQPMYWYTLWLNRAPIRDEDQDTSSESKKRALAVNLWQKLPVPLSQLIGPYVRKHIDL